MKRRIIHSFRTGLALSGIVSYSSRDGSAAVIRKKSREKIVVRGLRNLKPTTSYQRIPAPGERQKLKKMINHMKMS